MTNKIKKPEVEFVKDTHTYTRTTDGKLLTGVTTILKEVLHKPFLIAWAAKEAVKFLEDKQELIKELEPKKYLELLQDAKKSYQRKSNEALDKGSQVHELIENYIQGKIKKQKRDVGIILDKDVANSFNQFLEWEKSNEVKWLAVEVLVASEKHDFAGTLDGLAYVNKELTLIDFKTSNQISEDYYLQTAAYQICLEEMGFGEIKQRLILRIPKNGGGFEAQVVPTPYEFDRDTFLHCREVHRWIVNINNNIKKNENYR